MKHGGGPGVNLLIDEVQLHTPSSIPTIAYINGKVLYADGEESTGYELWCASDSLGSAALVKDGNPGLSSTFPIELTKADNIVYYRGGYQGRQLWRSDGTEAGTFMVFQIMLTNQNIQSNSLKTLGDKAYFLLQKTSGETELWVSDGSVVGTAKAADVPSSVSDVERFEAFFLHGKYIYLAQDQQNLNSEWVASDGTPAGTEILLDFPANAGYHAEYYGTRAKSILDGSFFFFYCNADNDSELWKSDGTAAGTQKVKVIDAYASFLLGGTQKDIFFLVFQSNEAVHLWASDGTELGTRPIKFLGNESHIIDHLGFATTDSTVCFESPILTPPDFLYRSDGTEQGTYRVEGALAPHLAGSDPIGFVPGPNDAVFFRANLENHVTGVWRSEPDAPFEVTRLDTTSKHSYLQIATPMSVSDKVLWFSDDKTLSVTDEAGAISQIHLPVSYSGSWSLGPGGAIYFTANNDKSIWRSDGTPSGTFEFFAAPTNSIAYPLKTVGDSIYFLQHSNQPYLSLWSSDGTSNGTQAIGTIYHNGSTVFLREIDNRLAYSTYALNPSAQTLHVRGFSPVVFPQLPSYAFAGIAVADSQLFALGPRAYNAGNYQHSLWVVDGDQPILLKDFATVPGYSHFSDKYQNRLHELSGKVVFGAGLTTGNAELWTSDGTTNGTYEVRDLNPAGSSKPDNFVRYNDHLLLFTASDGVDVSWWATDGSWNGTFKVSSLATVKDYFVPKVENAYLHENRLYFSMNDGITGQEPWVMVLEDSLVVSTIVPLLQKNDLAVWPNPAKGFVNITLENQFGKPVWAEITNHAGQIVYRQKHTLPDFGALSIRLPHQSKGIHFLRLTTENGKIWTQKLILPE
ncbi:MAG: T9SS type A sorting domain-containing protein [Saprospiraceae bacterium]